MGETVMVNIGSTSTGARILQTKADLAKIALNKPVCSAEGEKLAISRRVDKHWRLIGWGKIRRGIKIVANESGGDKNKKEKLKDKKKKDKKKEKNEANGPEKEKKKKKKKDKENQEKELDDEGDKDKKKKKKKRKKI